MEEGATHAEIRICMELTLWGGKTGDQQRKRGVLEGGECCGGGEQRRMTGSAVLAVSIVVRKVACEQRVQG